MYREIPANTNMICMIFVLYVNVDIHHKNDRLFGGESKSDLRNWKKRAAMIETISYYR